MKLLSYEDLVRDVADFFHRRFIRTQEGIGTYAESAHVEFEELMDVQKELLVSRKMHLKIREFMEDWKLENDSDLFDDVTFKINSSLNSRGNLEMKKRKHQEIGMLIEESIMNHFKKEIMDDINREIDFINSKYNPYLTHSQKMEFETGIRATGEI